MEIYQILPHLWYGDAIGNHVLGLDRLLAQWGYASSVYAKHIHPKLLSRCRPLSDYRPRQKSITFYHYSIAAAEATELFQKSPGKRALIYHNITPHHFFSGYSDEAYHQCLEGRAALPELLPTADLALGDSPFNCEELAQVGFDNPRVLPILVDFDKFAATPPCPWTLGTLESGWTNFLFVGSFLPHKRQDDVIRAFARYNQYVNRRSQLALVGGNKGLAGYLTGLRPLARSLGVAEHVLIATDVTFPELVAYYRSAQVFVCLSEHEGFCVPLLEAMHHRLPVVAYAAAAVPGTLGHAGVQIKEKDWPVIAELLHLLVSDHRLRDQVLCGQTEQLRDFRPEVVGAQFKAYVDELQAA